MSEGSAAQPGLDLGARSAPDPAALSGEDIPRLLALATRHAAVCAAFVARYGALGEVFPADFLSSDVWGTLLSPATREALDRLSLAELRAISLRSATPEAGELRALPEKGAAHHVLEDTGAFFAAASTCRLEGLVVDLDALCAASPAACASPDWVSTLRKHRALLAPKKMHEIPRMARCVQWLALASDRPVQVLDVGSGKGYLGSFLSVACGIRTVSVEGSHMIAAGAVRRHANLSRLFRGREAGHELRVAWLSKTAADGESFAASSRQDGATAAQEKDEAAQRTILTGLHACGDLTSTAVAAFVQRPELWGLVAVGCCYNMMAPETFPVSGHLRRSGLTLSRALRMLALKSLEREAGQQPAEGGEPALTSARTLWRPLLNLLLRDELGVDVRARSEELSVGRRASKSESWPVYARSALSHLGFEPSSVPNETALRELEVRCVGTSLERVLKLEVLRLMLAAAVESLIALDRLLSVLESGQCAAAWIVRVFEPSESPRCLGIVCRRC